MIRKGYCGCGCGQKTKIATQNDASTDRIAGQPMRFVSGHNTRRVGIDYSPTATSIEAPLCACGCGRRTKRATYTASTCGIVKGQFLRYVRGHGHASGLTSQTPEAKAFRGARSLCGKGAKPGDYRNYAGRGIKFLFTSFEQWFAELGPRPTPNHSVDRINNDGNYEPGNVRWALPDVQIRNRRIPKFDKAAIIQMHTMRQSGATFQEIATRFETTKQYAWIVLRIASEFIEPSA